MDFFKVFGPSWASHLLAIYSSLILRTSGRSDIHFVVFVSGAAGTSGKSVKSGVYQIRDILQIFVICDSICI